MKLDVAHFALAVLVLAGAQFAHAASTDEAFLEANGFPFGQFTVLSQWDEAPAQAEGRLITGYSLQPNGSTARVDIYRDGDTLLTDAAREALGIRAKSWDASTANAPAQANVQFDAPSQPKTRPVGASLKSKHEVVELPPFEMKENTLSTKDTALQEKPSNQVGDIRDLIAPIVLTADSATLGKWRALADGAALWTTGIRSPGATGQRVHIAGLASCAAARVTVYNPANADEAFVAETTNDETWMPTIFNEEVVVEVYVPAGVSRASLRITIDKSIHIYAPLSRFQKVGAGSCNLDVTCYPAWADTSKGICGLGVVTAQGALFCTGTLIADTDNCSTTPYVLTAHHCVGGQGGSNGATNLEFYWFFQTPTCNGTAPGLPFVPRTTGGATYLAGTGGNGNVGGGNDFTLLRMINTPPSGVTYVGWSAAVPALTTEVTDIHHPRGEYKRISFGTLTNTDNPFSTDFLEVTWHDGTTEPGSSGSALMLTASQQIIGQLWGGGASCSSQTDPDFFGRFSRTYPVVQSILDPGPNECAFQSAQLLASEADASAIITVSLTRPAGVSGLDVDYAATPGTAIPGTDFTPTNGTLHFGPGISTRTFLITLAQDTHADDGVTVALSLSAPSCGAISATLGSAELVIADDDPDTDGDNVSDFDEINGTYGPPTNPNLADSDHDGLTDYQELFDVYGYHTDPNDADTDDDNVPDFLEIVSGTDPTVADAAGLTSLLLPWFEDCPSHP